MIITKSLARSASKSITGIDLMGGSLKLKGLHTICVGSVPRFQEEHRSITCLSPANGLAMVTCLFCLGSRHGYMGKIYQLMEMRVMSCPPPHITFYQETISPSGTSSSAKTPNPLSPLFTEIFSSPSGIEWFFPEGPQEKPPRGRFIWSSRGWIILRLVLESSGYVVHLHCIHVQYMVNIIKHCWIYTSLFTHDVCFLYLYFHHSKMAPVMRWFINPPD